MTSHYWFSIKYISCNFCCPSPKFSFNKMHQWIAGKILRLKNGRRFIYTLIKAWVETIACKVNGTTKVVGTTSATRKDTRERKDEIAIVITFQSFKNKNIDHNVLITVKAEQPSSLTNLTDKNEQLESSLLTKILQLKRCLNTCPFSFG